MPDWARFAFHTLETDSFAGKVNWACQLVSGVEPVLVIV